MSKNMKVQIEVTAKDSASPVLNKAAKEAEKSFKQTGQIAQQSSKTQADAARKAAQAREVLGVRSERTIQRELMQTRAAYERLKRSGVASQNELRRAAEATKNRVRELNAELGKTSFGDKMRGVGRGLMNVGVGVAAGAMVAAPKMMAAADYDMALARVADTGYSGGSIEEKTQGKEKIHQAIKSSLQYGGTKEDAISAINELMAQGKVSVDSALALLPTIQKNATATGASSAELTNVVNSMLRFGVKESEIQTALDYMNASGKAGGFELKDMAQYFPQILAGAGSAGLGGLEDLKKVGVNLQQVYGVSGGASETATNLNNYYAKVKASSTADNLEKLEFTDAKGKKQSVDMKKSMQHYMKQGQNASEALLSIIGDVLKHDKEYQALLMEYQNTQGEDKKAIMQKVAKYIEGTKVAEIMPDLQAGMATYAMRNDQETAQNVQAQYQIADKGNYNEESFKWISQQNAFEFQRVKNAHEMTQIENFNKVNDVAAEVAKGYSQFAQEFPNLHSALTGATEAVKIFGAALVASDLLDMLRGSKVTQTVASGGVTAATGAAAKGGNLKGIPLGTFASAAGMTLMLSGSESQETKQTKIDYSAAVSAVRNGNATDEQKRFLYEQNKRAVEKYDNGNWFTRLTMSDSGVEQARIAMRNYETEKGIRQTSETDANLIGNIISAGIEASLAAQNHTIANHITIEMDGRVIAEQVSEQQFNFNKRMQ